MAIRKQGRLRIIGGQWRSRLISFDAEQGVRPTPDRVRQTVFDWLAPRIEGAHCLDLFAGSGAMGLEALSRGAARATFVDVGQAQLAGIRASIEALACADRAQVIARGAQHYLAAPADKAFDLVFVDPPFASQIHENILDALRPWLGSEARIYLEWPSKKTLTLPETYSWEREKIAGQVSFGLLCVNPSGAEK